MDYQFKKSPFSKSEKRAFEVESLDFSGTEWEGSEEFLPMVRTIAGRFAREYGAYLFDDLVSGLMLSLRHFVKSYDPSKGPKKPYFMVCLGLKARTLMRELKKKHKFDGYVQMKSYDIENVQLRLDFEALKSTLTKDEFWFLEAYYEYEGSFTEICKKWNETRRRISITTAHRRVEEALLKVVEGMREWRTT